MPTVALPHEPVAVTDPCPIETRAKLNYSLKRLPCALRDATSTASVNRRTSGIVHSFARSGLRESILAQS